MVDALKFAPATALALVVLVLGASAQAEPSQPLRGTVALTAGDLGPGGKRQVYLLDLATRKLRQITRGLSHQAFGWSPDGSRLLVAELDRPGGSGWPLYAIRADGSGRVLLASRVDAFEASWSPDGKRVAFRGPGQSLQVVNADGTHPRVLATGLLGGGFLSGHFSWSPNGKRIVFARAKGLFTVATTGTPAVRRLWYWSVGLPPAGIQPAWSPDGSRIVFVSTSGVCCPGSIAVMRADGSELRLLRLGHGPVWSPDSSRIAFRNDRVQMMRRDGSRVRTWPGSWSGITFSPDSKSIAYIGGSGHQPLGILYVAPIDGSRPVRVLHTTRQAFLLPLWRGGTWTTEAG